MATIIDVARMAGVSQGTASNVLNGKGNVSSEKIKAVEEAAKKLGYTINERAKMLRKGSGNIICVIVPSMERRHYRDFYYCLKSYAEKRGYTAELLITNDNRQTEYSMIQWAKSVMAMGVASITCLGEKEVKEAYTGFEKLCFVERKATDDLDYIGFDYESAGGQIAETVISARYHNVLVVTDSLKFSNENEFCRGLYKMLAQEKIKFFHITTDSRRVSHAIINTLVQENEYDAIITTNIRFAEKIRNVVTNFSAGNQTPIFTLSPITSLPEKDYRKYELNYGLVGKMAAEKIIGDSKENGAEKELICENDGFREWNQITLNKTPADHLRILTLDSPETMILQGLAKLYTEETGTQIQFDVFSYDDIYEQFMKAENSDYYDIFRMDVTWLPLLSERILVPLDDMTPDIDEVYKEYIPALIDKYSRVHGKAYALPITPSTQLLFYRKDLFENTVIKRLYSEKYKAELKIPKTFEEYNKIAEFFATSDRLEEHYFSNLTLGNLGVTATEFLTRLFSHKNHLYGKDGMVVINDTAGVKALEELLTAKQYTDKKVVHWWKTSAKDFADGKLVMMINFSNYASEILGAGSKVVGNIGVAMVPGKNPIYGGGTVGISKNSRRKEDAFAFIKWITTEPAASGMAALGSVSPCAKTYNKYDIIDVFPWLELSKDCFSKSHTRRIPADSDKAFDEIKFLNIVGMAVENVLMGFLPVEESLNRAQKLIDEEINK